MIELALEKYMTKDGARPVRKMDMTLKKMIARKNRLFLFASNDSTSSILGYCYYLLSSPPECMARVRAEHDSIFGTDLITVPPAIVRTPHLLNQTPYTHAVIKEVLRLFSPAASLCESAPAVEIVDPHGRRYSTRGTFIWVIHQALHRNPAYWKFPDDFLFERWLTTDADDDLHLVKGAYRLYELGPQNCIDQSLATLELRCALVMTACGFNIRAAYDLWDDAVYPRQAAILDYLARKRLRALST